MGGCVLEKGGKKRGEGGGVLFLVDVEVPKG